MLLIFLKRFGWCCLWVLIQALILNNVHLFGYATPFLYVYLLLKFNADTSRYALLLWGFFMGLAVDVFSNTPGVNAAATTMLAFARPFLVSLFAPRDVSDDMIPGFRSMGAWPFMRYVVLSLLLHQTVLILLQTFSFIHPEVMLLKLLSGVTLTSLCICGLEMARK